MVKTTIAVLSASVATAAALSSAGATLYGRTATDRANCKALNARTIDSNQHIRLPLRDSNRALSLIFETTLRRGPKLDQREISRLSKLPVKTILAEVGHGKKHDREITAALALKFKSYADEVRLVPPLKC
jgi:hypothetical protein